jgi:hypothetical protein
MKIDGKKQLVCYPFLFQKREKLLPMFTDQRLLLLLRRDECFPARWLPAQQGGAAASDDPNSSVFKTFYIKMILFSSSIRFSEQFSKIIKDMAWI